jgi:hypothetical protein
MEKQKVVICTDERAIELGIGKTNEEAYECYWEKGGVEPFYNAIFYEASNIEVELNAKSK